MQPDEKPKCPECGKKLRFHVFLDTVVSGHLDYACKNEFHVVRHNENFSIRPTKPEGD